MGIKIKDMNEETPDDEGIGEQIAVGRTEKGKIDKETMEDRKVEREEEDRTYNRRVMLSRCFERA